MNKEQQITIWQFILAYKKATGEPVNYLHLIKNEEYQQRIFEQARDSGNADLARLADRIADELDEDIDTSTLLEDESESMLLAEAPDEVWAEPPAAPEPAPVPPPAASLADSKPENPADRYAYRLRGALRRDEFSLLHRRALDRFAHKAQLSPEQVLELENHTRSALRLAPLNWEQELRSVITDLLQHNDTLTNLKTQLLHTYARPGRLSEEQFQQVYATAGRPPPAEPAPVAAPRAAGNSPNKVWIGVAVLLVLAAVLFSQL